MSQTSKQDLMTIEEISQEKRWPIGTVRYWIQKGTFCPSVRIGRRRYVRRGDLEKFIADKFADGAAG